MKLMTWLKDKWQNLKLRLNLRLWLKLLACCEKMTSSLLKMLWSDKLPTSLHLRQNQIRSLEDMSMSLPLVESLILEIRRSMTG